jgi:surfactin family lipopeptide synthetase C
MKVEHYLHTANHAQATGTRRASAGLLSVHEMFEAQAERTPATAAVAFAGESISYRELNERANRLARRLQTLGLRPESLCGLCVERSIEMLVGVLGILKTGAAYVPLDAAYPQERLAFMLEDARMPVLLAERQTVERLETLRPPDIKIVLLGAESPEGAQDEPDNPHVETAAHHPAYVIFTSGSTGRPKG